MPIHAGYNVVRTSVEYYTPAKYVDAARELMGNIDLDPASCAEANKAVQASCYYTLQDNGLLLPWYGRVWLNPPYGMVDNISEQQRWSGKLIAEFQRGNVTEAVLLCNASDMSAKWAQRLLKYPHCLTDHRIRFQGPGGKRGLMGSAFYYFGCQLDRFIDLFEPFGSVMPPAYPKRHPFLRLTEL